MPRPVGLSRVLAVPEDLPELMLKKLLPRLNKLLRQLAISGSSRSRGDGPRPPMFDMQETLSRSCGADISGTILPGPTKADSFNLAQRDPN